MWIAAYSLIIEGGGVLDHVFDALGREGRVREAQDFTRIVADELQPTVAATRQILVQQVLTIGYCIWIACYNTKASF